MADFIDRLQELMHEEAAEIRRREAEENRSRLEQERARLDAQYSQELAQRRATADRTLTLNLAWAAAELLNAQKAPTEYWQCDTEVFETIGRGKRMRSIPVGYRTQLTAEGWPLFRYRINHGTYVNRSAAYTLLLTPSSGDGNHLTYLRQGPFTRMERNHTVTPENVHTLPKMPLSEDDMDWPESWPSETDHFGQLVVNDHIPLLAKNSGSYTSAHYEKYNEAKIEDRIQRAIAHVSAKYLIVEP